MSAIKTILSGLGFFSLVGLFALASGYLFFPAVGSVDNTQTAQPSRSTLVQKIVANGTIVPRKEVRIKPQVSGVIEELFVTPGQQVQAGTLMARIRPVPDPVEVNKAEADVEVARLRYQYAKSEQQRAQSLRTRNAMSQSEFLAQKLDLDIAARELEMAQQALELILRGESQQSDRSSSRVLATVGGTVLDRPTSDQLGSAEQHSGGRTIAEGDFVIRTNEFSEGTTLFAIADMSELLFRGYVDEIDVARLQPGMELTVLVGPLDERSFPAKLSYIAPTGIERDGTRKFEIKASLQLPEEVLIRPGYSATAEVVVAQRDDALVIEERLLQFRDGQPFVEVQSEPGQFEPREVETGLSDGLKIEIVSGLSMEDVIRVPAGL